MERRAKVVKTLTGGVERPVQEEQDRGDRGRGRPDRRRQGPRRRHRVRGREGRDPRHRLGPAADPGRAVRRAHHRHRGGVGARGAAATLAVVGAGASGTEIASAYARLGAEVKLFEALDRVLPTEDADISKLAERGFKKQGIKVHTEHAGRERRDRRRRGHVLLRRRAGRGRLARHRRRPRARRRGASGSRTPASSSTRTGSSRSTARCARAARGSMRSATSCPARRSRTRPPTRASSPSRTRPGCETHPIEYADIPRATFCTPNVASLRAHRGAGARGRPRRRRRQGAVRRGRRRHGLRRPHRPHQDRRRQEVRRDARRPHRRARRRPS